MKQRLYNWIYRTLRKMGVRSTEYLNMDDLFEQVKALKTGDKSCSVYYSILWYTHNGGFKDSYWSVQNHTTAFQGDTFQEAFTKYRIAQEQGKTPTEEKSIEV